jgi:hypothetical protein
MLALHPKFYAQIDCLEEALTTALDMLLIVAIKTRDTQQS